jgi:DNA modification methylase
MSTRILVGDCRHVLKSLPAGSVQMAVTSPPYYQLRNYDHPDQIGLEQTPEQYIAELVAVFREVRRVLRDDGTIWVNIGDTYAGSGRGGNSGGSSTLEGGQETQDASIIRRTRGKGEIGATARMAAVPARGSRLPAGFHADQVENGAIGRAWVPPPAGLKQKDLIGIPWMLAFALRADGWFLRQDIIWSKPNPMPESVTDRCTKSHEYVFLLSKSERYYFDAEAIAEPATWADSGRTSATAEELSPDRKRTRTGGQSPSFRAIREKRNKRSVWSVSTKPYREAHFATFPPDLIEPCILAGSSAGGVVLDPFGGAGTTGLVCDRLQRDAILIELNPRYAGMAQDRISGDANLFAEVVTA